MHKIAPEITLPMTLSQSEQKRRQEVITPLPLVVIYRIHTMTKALPVIKQYTEKAPMDGPMAQSPATALMHPLLLAALPELLILQKQQTP